MLNVIKYEQEINVERGIWWNGLLKNNCILMLG